ncbi:hypothetical protein LPJ72_004546 [Coemansia sp. Benny D160-2]|nr:hypothetical protein LPJ72_004546 [Coemansia sp. Benny D160-2]
MSEGTPASLPASPSSVGSSERPDAKHAGQEEEVEVEHQHQQHEEEEEEEKYYSGTEGNQETENDHQQQQEQTTQENEQEVESSNDDEEDEEEEESALSAELGNKNVRHLRPANEEPRQHSSDAEDSEGEGDAVEDSSPQTSAMPIEQPTSSGIDMNDALAKARAIAAKLGTMQKPQMVAVRAAETGAPGAHGGDEQEYEDNGDNEAPAEQGDAFAEGNGQDVYQDRQQRRRSASPEARAGGGVRGTRGGKRERSRSRDRGRHEARRDTRRRFDGGAEGAGGAGAGGEYGGPPAHQQPVELLVPSGLSGMIIGRSGSNLRAIEQRHGVRVQFDANFDRRAPERRVTIEGPPQQAEAAKQDILDFVDRNQRQEQQSRPPPQGPMADGMGPGGGLGLGGNALSQEAAELGSAGMAVIAVPSSKVGLIIGRRGESIKSIQMLSGARVQVQPDNGRGAPERPIHLIGSPDQIEAARVRIMEIITTDKPPPRDAAPYGRPDYGPGAGAGGYPMSGPHSHGQQQQMQHPQGAGGRMAPGGYGMPQDRFGGPPQQQQQQPGMHTEEIQIPAEAVGVIIGRSGETIKHLQQSSGTRIQILQGPEHSGPFRTVTISGEFNACMRGRRMIEDKIDGMQDRLGAGPSAPAMGGGGGYGARGGAYGGYGQQHHQSQHHQQPPGGGYGGYGYGAEPMDMPGADQKSQPWGGQPQHHHQQQQQQPQQQYFGGYQQPQQQQQQPQQQQPQQQQQAAGGDQTMQWTNQQTADYYAQYAATNPEYAQYADYYRKLAEKDPNGIVPSG